MRIRIVALQRTHAVNAVMENSSRQFASQPRSTTMPQKLCCTPGYTGITRVLHGYYTEPALQFFIIYCGVQESKRTLFRNLFNCLYCRAVCSLRNGGSNAHTFYTYLLKLGNSFGVDISMLIGEFNSSVIRLMSAKSSTAGAYNASAPACSNACSRFITESRSGCPQTNFSHRAVMTKSSGRLSLASCAA